MICDIFVASRISLFGRSIRVLVTTSFQGQVHIRRRLETRPIHQACNWWMRMSSKNRV